MIERKKTLNVFRDAKDAWGSYDDFPVGQPGTDPMPHLSRNRCAQPFWLVSEVDQVIVHMSGRGVIRFEEIETREVLLEPGDTVYIPACTPHRLFPLGEVIQIRLKPERAREAAVFYCSFCRENVFSQYLPEGIPQQGYWDAVQAFEAYRVGRTCRCDAPLEAADLGDTAWPAVAAALRASV